MPHYFWAVHSVGLWLERKLMQELISESQNIDNLHYLRNILKANLDYWVTQNKNGELTQLEEAMDIVTNMAFIQDILNSELSVIAVKDFRKDFTKILTKVLEDDGTKTITRKEIKSMAQKKPIELTKMKGIPIQ